MTILKKIQVDQKLRNVKFVAKLEMTEEILENMSKTFIFQAHLCIIASFVARALMLKTTCISTYLKPIEINNKYFQD